MKNFRSLVVIGALATATVSFGVDFSSLSQPGDGLYSLGSSFSLGGLDFNINGGFMAIWENSSSNHPQGGPDSTTSLLSYYEFDTITVSKTGGGTFGLDSVDLAEWGAGTGFDGPFDVTFTGDLYGGGIVTNTFSVTPAVGASPLLETFDFSGFSNLADVYVTEGSNAYGNAWQFDNLNVTPASTVAAPPAMAVCLVYAANRFRRRAKSHKS